MKRADIVVHSTSGLPTVSTWGSKLRILHQRKHHRPSNTDLTAGVRVFLFVAGRSRLAQRGCLVGRNLLFDLSCRHIIQIPSAERARTSRPMHYPALGVVHDVGTGIREHSHVSLIFVFLEYVQCPKANVHSARVASAQCAPLEY